ncbi:MAG: GntR family transcriptional regulator, partial [Pseudomonadota bacterium]
MALKSIKSDRRRLADEVYHQLIDAILSGEIGPDDRLVQERLAAEMEISRTPVREALLRLEQEGMLVTSARGGFVLYRMTEGEIRELYQARAAVESQAARILASQNDGFKNRELRS